ncbi:protein LTV1 [Histomonas meleagridis]|uniref:protein LTV1-like n=1 Tax=Histomonas meleagridis TaxID=135588 RepID=UPI00355A92A2|nr:protein LTV1 [Histomonas meleagridis]KAH0798168.1 protein LTV1-like [Histomonas meleagridis]
MSKAAKRKTVTFQLVQRSLDDPLSADPNAPSHVLVPIYIGADVDSSIVDELAKQMTPDQQKKAIQKKKSKKGIGSRYNSIFGMPDDGHDYSQYFKCIDEETDDGIFVAPDGSIHDLKTREISNVDEYVQTLGFDKELFGTEADPSMPKLVNDTENLLGGEIDPDVLLAMDDPNADVLDDDFIAKCLDAEAEEDDTEDADEKEVVDQELGTKRSIARSRMSAATSHSSHISHRSEAMDMVEEKVEYLLNTVYNDEEEDLLNEEEEDGGNFSWDDIIEDFKQFQNPHEKYVPSGKSTSAQKVTDDSILVPNEENIENEEEEYEEEEENEKKKEKWDCQSILETMSNLENRPVKLREEGIQIKKKQNKVKKEDEEEKPKIVQPNVMPKQNETKEEAKARKKAVKEYNRQRRAEKKLMKQKFVAVNKKVKKSIAASGGTRGAKIITLN